MKIRVGIIFGGISREREVSFAGGRTVYDNLNKTLFDPVPLFIDSFGNFVLLNWQYIYKGSIRDFYPPVEALPPSPNHFQVYAESLGDLTREEQEKLIRPIGERIEVSELKELIDFAFLCLHGPYGEDGRIQGLLEYLNIPYTGSGIYPSAVGINKPIQREIMINEGYLSPPYITIKRKEWLGTEDRKTLFTKVKEEVGLPAVIKSANQGSSIGVSVVAEEDIECFRKAMNKSFFVYELTRQEWLSFDAREKVSFVRNMADIREGIGVPVNIDGKIHYHPEELFAVLDNVFDKTTSSVLIQGTDGENEVMIEGFIEGKEFSCIVIQDEEDMPIALPPTEIRKGKEVFDYRSKYLPGLSSKITPIDLPGEQIENICKECERLFNTLHCNVYARIDGFIRSDGEIFLFDPNTISGMMPSSFFFHQAAEIGLNPSQYLTYIIRTSLAQRLNDYKNYHALSLLLKQLDEGILQMKTQLAEKKKVAVILGGYSSERHISVESGRNIYEKLSSSSKYQPIPVFLSGNDKKHLLYQIPVNILLKDNADDIKEKLDNFYIHDAIKKIIRECKDITGKYVSQGSLAKPERITYDELARMVDGAFIALHGRPGEDGAVQAHLEKRGVPYNGSGVQTSRITINKYETNEILKSNGFSVAEHALVYKKEWEANKKTVVNNILKQFAFPFITKPVDDGCSSAVKKIKNEKELNAFIETVFRNEKEISSESREVLHLKQKEEFPMKDSLLVEALITKGDAEHFLEITEGMLTRLDEHGNISYEMFEASETLTEGDVLSLEEKFLAGQGQNITPARYDKDPARNTRVSELVKKEIKRAVELLKIEGYARIDAFVRIYKDERVEVIFIEVNSLPGMTPATCIFHQCAMNGYKPYDFIDNILEFGLARTKKPMAAKT